MSKKLKMWIVSIAVVAIFLLTTAGLIYQMQWTNFKKDFATSIKAVTAKYNEQQPNGMSYKLKSTTHHTVIYTITTIEPITSKKIVNDISEHYTWGKRFDIDKITGKL